MCSTKIDADRVDCCDFFQGALFVGCYYFIQRCHLKSSDNCDPISLSFWQKSRASKIALRGGPLVKPYNLKLQPKLTSKLAVYQRPKPCKVPLILLTWRSKRGNAQLMTYPGQKWHKCYPLNHLVFVSELCSRNTM